MSRQHSRHPRRVDALRLAVAIALCVALFAHVASAKPKIRDSFFEVYPGAIGTALGSVPSQSSHCGVCHWQFQGAGARNPYGANLEAVLPGYPNNAAGRFDAILSIELEDPDGDGFSTFVEVTDTTNYINTPTFPGLTPGNVGGVTQVNLADIQDHLVPTAGGDTTPPDVIVLAPDGGELLTANASTTVEWIAGDASGIAGINLYVSLDGGASYAPVALGLSNTGSHT